MVEILHTVLLGVDKYAWYDLHSNWNSAQQDLFTVRLQSTNMGGLNIPPIRAAYMMQYRNNLIGKHFKTLMQTCVFHIQDLVSDKQFVLIRALGELAPVLWASSIDVMDQYLVRKITLSPAYHKLSNFTQGDLQILVDNVLDAFSAIDPAKILIKIKLHMLAEIVNDIRRRGPAVRFSTEVFECFNAIFRMCSILSNHQAPSRDIAVKFTDLERVKQILSGGYWYQADDGWTQAGKDVRTLLHRTPILQKHLGWTAVPVWHPGAIKLPAKTKRTPILTENSKLAEASDIFGIGIDHSMRWILGAYVTASSGDRGYTGSWAIFRLQVREEQYILLSKIEANVVSERLRILHH